MYFPEGADNHVGFGHGIGDDLILQGAQDGFQKFPGHDVGKKFLALGVEFKLLQRAQQKGRTSLEYRIGKTQIPGVIGQGDRHVVVAHSGQEQNQVVVEVIAQLLLYMAYGTHLQQSTQAGSRGDRYPRDNLHQALRFPVDHRAQSDVIVIDHIAQSDGIRIGLLAPHQLPGLAAVLVGTQTSD